MRPCAIVRFAFGRGRGAESTIRPPERLLLGTALAELGRRIGLTDEDIAAFEQMRDKAPAEPVRFE